MTTAEVETLSELLLDRVLSVFRVRLGGTPPECVQPMQMQPIKKSRPIKVKVRRYGREQRIWMDKYLDHLFDMGLN